MNTLSIKSLTTQLCLLLALTIGTVSPALSATRDEVVLYLNDPLGSAVAAFDKQGELCWEETFTPYGEKTVLDDSFQRTGCGIVAEERGFTGHSEDYEIDLVYMQQRYYDPTIGRFLSIDPVGPVVGDPRTLNRYTYAANNPYKYVDPTGEFFFLAPAAPLIASAATFIAKEVAAEVLSQVTHGASDFLSTRRMAKKGFIKARTLLDPAPRQQQLSSGKSVRKQLYPTRARKATIEKAKSNSRDANGDIVCGSCGKQVPDDQITMQHEPALVDTHNSIGFNTDQPTRNNLYNDTITGVNCPTCQAIEGGSIGREYRRDTGPNFEPRPRRSR